MDGISLQIRFTLSGLPDDVHDPDLMARHLQLPRDLLLSEVPLVIEIGRHYALLAPLSPSCQQFTLFHNKLAIYVVGYQSRMDLPLWQACHRLTRMRGY